MNRLDVRLRQLTASLTFIIAMLVGIVTVLLFRAEKDDGVLAGPTASSTSGANSNLDSTVKNRSTGFITPDTDTVTVHLDDAQSTAVIHCRMPERSGDELVVAFTNKGSRPDDFIAELRLADPNGNLHRGIASVSALKPAETQTADVVAQDTNGNSIVVQSCAIKAVQHNKRVVLIG